MTFATLDDYTDRFPDATDDELIAAQVALNAACAEIQRRTSQTFTVVEGDVITIDGTGTRILLLPELPIVAVNSVIIDKDLATEEIVTDFRVDADGRLYLPRRSTATPYRRCNHWPRGFANITIDYDHGYAAVPADLIDLAVRAAFAGVAYQPGLAGETIGGYSYTRQAVVDVIDAAGKGILGLAQVKRIPAP